MARRNTTLKLGTYGRTFCKFFFLIYGLLSLQLYADMHSIYVKLPQANPGPH